MTQPGDLQGFYRKAGKIAPILLIVALVLFAIGF